MEKVYFETSALNYLLEAISPGALLNMREFQHQKKRVLYASPITLWEVMLAGNKSDYLLYFAQNLFYEKLLATPSEIIVRYLLNSYPENKVNYEIFTNLEIGEIWTRMAGDSSVTFFYDHEALKKKTDVLRSISRNLSSIIRYPELTPNDPTLKDIAHIVNTYYECLTNDGFIPTLKSDKYDLKVLFKIFLVFAIGLFVFRIDLDSAVIEEFWGALGMDDEDHTKRMMQLFEKYPDIFKRGPLLEISIMAYHQLTLGRQNRGLILDSLHMVYAPYVDTIISADDDFKELRAQENHYAKKLAHIREVAFKEVHFTNVS